MLNRFAAVFGASLLALPAAAHVTLDQSTMPADSYLRLAIRVPPGCDGAATTGIRLPAMIHAVMAAYADRPALGQRAVEYVTGADGRP